MHERRGRIRAALLLGALIALPGVLGNAAAAAGLPSLFADPDPTGTDKVAEKSIGGTLQVAVGAGGAVFLNQGGGWVDLEFPLATDLFAVDALSLDDLWVCGASGVMRYDGEAWVDPEDFGQSMLAIMVRPDGVVAVGASGRVMRNRGSGWVNLGSGTSLTLNGVWGVSADDFWVCGNNGLIRRYRGGQWSTVASGTGQQLNAVWGMPGVGPFFGGANGTFLEHRGGAVQAIATGNSNALLSIHGTGADDVWACGAGGWVWRYDGETLTTPTPGGSTVYRAIRALPSGLATIAGDGGVVQNYDGAGWSNNNIGGAGALRGLVSLPSQENAGWWDGFARAPRGAGLLLGGGTGLVTGMVVHQQRLVVHGVFDQAGDVGVGNIAAFDGETWSALPAVGQSPQTYTRSLDVYQGDLVVAAYYPDPGEYRVSRLVGENWETMGVVPGNTILHLRTMTVGGQERLYLAGVIPYPGDSEQSGIYRWEDGSGTWETVGSGAPYGFVYGMTAFEGDLYAAVSFLSSDNGGRVMRLDDGNPGGVWTQVFSSDTILPRALLVHEGQLYAGCYGSNIDALRRYVPGGSLEWEPQGAVITEGNYIFNLIHWGDRILMAGSFPTIASLPSRRVAYWQDGTVHALGTGLNSNDAVQAAEFEGDLYVGASGLTGAGGRESWSLARWRDPDTGGDLVPTVTVQAPATVTAGQAATFGAEVESYQTVRSVTLSYRALDSEDFTHLAMEPPPGKSSGFFETTVPGADVSPYGLQHFVTVQTDQVAVTVPPDAGVAAGFTGVGVTFIATQEVAGRYELFGIPFAPSGTMRQIFENNLGGYDPANWRLERWNPASQRYLPFPQVPVAAPGRGYYIIQRDPRNMTISGSTTSTAGGTAIQLEPGWNMIATPYLFDIPWSEVSLPAGVQNQLIGRVDDDYADSTELEPWRGYFVYNAGAGPATLTIPALDPTKAAVPQADPAPVLAGRDGCDWLITIAPTQGERRDLVKAAGALAPGGEGPGDLNQPPSLPHDLAVWLERQEPDGRVQRLRRDLREVGAGAVWDLVVRPADSGGAVELVFDGLADVPSDLGVVLATPWGQADLRRDGGRWSKALAGETRLRLVVGDPQLVEEAAATLPQPHALLPAYPNPFNPTTTVAFTLPREGRVRLDVYDVAGRRVRTLVDEVRGPGRHEVAWDGADADGRGLSSGTYLLRLQAGDFSQTRKLALVR